MTRTSNSSKSESVTLRIPNELLAQIKAHAGSSTRGNVSLAILNLVEAGLSAVNNQESRDSALPPQLSETWQTVIALDEQVNQLNVLLQGNVLQRITDMESQLEEVLGESHA